MKTWLDIAGQWHRRLNAQKWTYYLGTRCSDRLFTQELSVAITLNTAVQSSTLIVSRLKYGGALTWKGGMGVSAVKTPF